MSVSYYCADENECQQLHRNQQSKQSPAKLKSFNINKDHNLWYGYPGQGLRHVQTMGQG